MHFLSGQRFSLPRCPYQRLYQFTLPAAMFELLCSPAPGNAMCHLTWSSPATWQVKTWRLWSALQMESREVLGLKVSHQHPSPESFLPCVLSSCPPTLARGLLNRDQHLLFLTWPSALLEVLVWECDFSSSFLNSILYGWITVRALQLRKQSLGHSGTGWQQWDASCSCDPGKSKDKGMTSFSGHIKVTPCDRSAFDTYQASLSNVNNSFM